MGDMSYDELENRFGFHPATDETRSMHSLIRKKFLGLAQDVHVLLPQGREKALALTALQESAMWANCAIACHLAPLESSDSQ